MRFVRTFADEDAAELGINGFDHRRFLRRIGQPVDRTDWWMSPHIVNAAGEFLPLPTSTFDLILSHEVIEHVQDDRAAIREMVRALKPGGRLAIIDFRMDSPHGPPKAARIEPSKVKAELARAGEHL